MPVCVVVGNVDAQDMQKRIQATFSSIAKGAAYSAGQISAYL